MKRLGFAFAAFSIAAISVPAAAQQQIASVDFIKAIQERDGAKAMEVLQGHPNVVDARDDKGDTALIIAINRGDEDYTAFLLNKGADPNTAGSGGNTPLIAASRVGFEQAVEWLLGQGARVDGTNKMGETALIVAVQQHQAPIVRHLLAAGADPDRSDSAAGYSARDYAARDPRARDILRMIEAKKPKPVGAAKTAG
jgi:ankyrin repeat protein